MKIIRHGVQVIPNKTTNITYRFYCYSCGCEWEADESEVFEDMQSTVHKKMCVCPDCKYLSSCSTTSITVG